VAKWVFVTHEPPTERGGDVGDKKDRTSGKIKEKAGTVTGDRGLRQKGRDEQAKGDIKKSAEKAKDAIKKQT
jgi:uncharacterized protein YjbJ (UPF0337 family)